MFRLFSCRPSPKLIQPCLLQLVGERLEGCAAWCGGKDKGGKGLQDLQKHIYQFQSTAFHSRILQATTGLRGLQATDTAAEAKATNTTKQVGGISSGPGGTGTSLQDGNHDSLRGIMDRGTSGRLSAVKGYPPAGEMQRQGSQSYSG
jgi:hypothetical protein